MLIYLNGRFLTRRPTGVDRFAYEALAQIDALIEAADPLVHGMRFEVLLPLKGDTEQTFSHLPTRRIGSHNGQVWEQWDLPRASKGGLLVNLCNTAPVYGARQLTVIHDAATARVPESYGLKFRLWYGFMIPRLYRTSASVCTVSEFSRNDLAALYGPRADVRVLPEGTGHMARVKADTTVLAKHRLRDRPYLLAVSSLSPHKNFAAVVRAAELMGSAGFDIAIAGGQNPKVFAHAQGNLPSSVKYVGYVTDGELKALYQNAACFVFPSIYEGYGLPPTEAMACGCPVVAAKAASIPEVCGDAALYFDPHNPKELAVTLQKIMSNAPLRESLRERGLARAARMQWRSTAVGLLQEIRRVAAP